MENIFKFCAFAMYGTLFISSTHSSFLTRFTQCPTSAFSATQSRLKLYCNFEHGPDNQPSDLFSFVKRIAEALSPLFDSDARLLMNDEMDFVATERLASQFGFTTEQKEMEIASFIKALAQSYSEGTRQIWEEVVDSIEEEDAEENLKMNSLKANEDDETKNLKNLATLIWFLHNDQDDQSDLDEDGHKKIPDGGFLIFEDNVLFVNKDFLDTFNTPQPDSSQSKSFIYLSLTAQKKAEFQKKIEEIKKKPVLRSLDVSGLQDQSLVFLIRRYICMLNPGLNFVVRITKKSQNQRIRNDIDYGSEQNMQFICQQVRKFLNMKKTQWNFYFTTENEDLHVHLNQKENTNGAESSESTPQGEEANDVQSSTTNKTPQIQKSETQSKKKKAQQQNRCNDVFHYRVDDDTNEF